MNTDWIVEGAKVAEFSWHGSRSRVALTTIERLTKTQIVLANGNRYNRDRLRMVGDNVYRKELMPADDQRVRDVIAAEAVGRFAFAVHDLLRRSPAGDVSSALRRFDEIAKLLAAARARVEGASDA